MKTACALFVASCNGTLRPLEIRYRVGKPTVIHCLVMTRRHPVSWQPVMAAPLAPSARTVAAVPVGSVSSHPFFVRLSAALFQSSMFPVLTTNPVLFLARPDVVFYPVSWRVPLLLMPTPHETTYSIFRSLAPAASLAAVPPFLTPVV